MEALHRGGVLDAQKENVDESFRGGALGSKGLSKGSGTPSAKRAAFSVHLDAKPDRKGLKDSAKKNRRALGDISNRHANRHEAAGDGEDGGVVKKSAGLGTAGPQAKTPSGKHSGIHLGKHSGKHPGKHSGKHRAWAATPAKSALPAINPCSDQVEEVEAAYGGLSSPASEAQHTKSFRENIARELQNDKTPTFFDDLDLPDPLVDWDSTAEKNMLEAGEAPSAWWAPPSPLRTEEAVVDISAYDDVPPPHDFADDSLDSLDDHDVLELALGDDLSTSASE